LVRDDSIGCISPDRVNPPISPLSWGYFLKCLPNGTLGFTVVVRSPGNPRYNLAPVALVWFCLSDLEQ